VPRPTTVARVRGKPVSSADLSLLVKQVSRLGPFGARDAESARSFLSVAKLARGEFLLREGEPARALVLLTHGYLREYYQLADGTQRTKAFAFAGDFSGSLADILSGVGSTCCIIAERDTRVIVIPYDEFSALADREPTWARVRLATVQFLLLRKARREYQLLALDAASRYATLEQAWPGIDEQVAAKHIASYLGITPVHLSRLRRAKKR
jgi:CRP-like cAMP-binding protein